ncbi:MULTISPECIES: AraC family transcriptional regulator [Paenibacillus]|uniref:helix-turn-helix transcriptional regulator n=1 Tax=Paenibacillus TaxID=44249 RepID=UPI002FDFC439
MSYFDAVKKAIDFIEERLEKELKMEDIARNAGFSPYHFHRIFQLLTKNTVSDYVRKRRLTHAAGELFDSEIRIIDLAVKYQFESQEAFTRAFKRMFRIPPGQFRRQTDLKDTTYRRPTHHASEIDLYIPICI